MHPKTVLAAGLGWLVLVTAVSTVAWQLITRAGEDFATTLRSSAAAGATTEPEGSELGSAPEVGAQDLSAAGPEAPSTTAAVSGSWHGRSGDLVAECTGTTVRLIAAQPEDGFHAEVLRRTAEELVVEFDATRESQVSETIISTTCLAGSPEFTSRHHSD